MSILRFRVTGTRAATETLLSRLNSMEQLERVEEVDDEIPGMREDSSSSELSDDIAGGSMHRILVETPHASTNDRVHDVVEMSARDLDLTVEFVERF